MPLLEDAKSEFDVVYTAANIVSVVLSFSSMFAMNSVFKRKTKEGFEVLDKMLRQMEEKEKERQVKQYTA
jgi:outer membrane protein assembly factor BamE (lipoprotein component of BamABCDE complex)